MSRANQAGPVAVLALAVLALGSGSVGWAAPVRVIQELEENGLPTLGSAHAIVTAEVFCSPLSPACAALDARLDELNQEFPDELRVVFRFWQPGTGDLDDEVMVEAWRQNKYFEMREALAAIASGQLGNVPYPQRQQQAILAAGLDANQVAEAKSSRRHAPRVATERLVGFRLGVTFESVVWNGKVQPVRMSQTVKADAARYFQEQLEVAKTLAAEGLSPERIYEDMVERHRPVFKRRAEKETARQIVSEHGAPSRGDAQADVNIVVFGEFPCNGNCPNLLSLLNTLQKTQPQRIRLTFKHWGLRMWPQSAIGLRTASQTLACVERQGKFWDYWDQVIARRLTTYVPTQQTEDALAVAGVDLKRLHADLASGVCEARRLRDEKDGEALGLRRQLTVFVNGRKAESLFSVEDGLFLLVEQELAPGLIERLSP